MKHKKLNSLAGIELLPGRIRAVELRRQGDGPAVVRSIDEPLAIDVFGTDSELAAREIHNKLQAGGINVRDCVLCLPLDRILVQNVDMKGVDAADADSYLLLEAERRLPFAPEDLAVASAKFSDDTGANWAMLAAIPLDQLEALERVLRLAKLRAVSITVALTSLIGSRRKEAEAVMLVGEHALQLAIGMGGGVSALKSFDDAIPEALSNGADETGVMDELQREWRLTMRRLPAGVRDNLKELRVYGNGTQRGALIDALGEVARQNGMTIIRDEVGKAGELKARTAANGLPALTRAAACALAGEAPAFEFWRPRQNRWDAFVRRMKARGVLGRVGIAAGVLAACVALAFAVQSWQLGRLEKQWETMRDQVAELKGIQAGLRARRDWTGQNSVNLEVMRAVAGAFPDTGSVWARTMNLDLPDSVKCSGLARDNKALLEMLEALRKIPGVQKLEFGQTRGENPVQFNLSFQWNAAAAHESR